MLDPERDFWGERKAQREVVLQWQQHPHSRNLYVFCLNDPVNNIDLDGHTAWWFFLTIPSSLTWAMPNTAIALLIVVGNLLMEIIGWVMWLFICLFKRDFAKKHYPWGNINPVNPFDANDRSHLWFGFDASRRLGVRGALERQFLRVAAIYARQRHLHRRPRMTTGAKPTSGRASSCPKIRTCN